MPSPLRLLTGLLLAGVLATSTAARAGEILVGNLDQPANGPLLYVDSTNYLAQEFTTGSEPVLLESIVASLGNLDRGSGDFSLIALLYADNGSGSPPDLPDPTSPPAPLATFTYSLGAIPASGFANVQFDPTSATALASGTSYWFVLAATSSDGTGSVDWQTTLSTSHSGPGSLPNAGLYFNDPSLGGWSIAPNEPQLLQVNVVPEPSSVALGAIAMGLVVAGASWRRSRRPVRP